jgi:diphosphomevalonate decarboxylase
MNPSISFTLNKSKTITEAVLNPLKERAEQVKFNFYLEGKHTPSFEPKIKRFFDLIKPYAPYIYDYEWDFYSQNTFPHSSGIASSASGFAALAKIIIALEKKLSNKHQSEEYYLKKTSFLARLGSGSASRSVAHPVMIWGKHPDIPDTSDFYAVLPKFDLHPVFKDYQDTIILVEKGQKKVSSSAGHDLMTNHPFKDIRKQQAFDRTLQMTNILQTGDLEQFINLVEAEALSLHALMMTSDPNYLLMQPDTLKIIKAIQELREEHNIPVCFTLDAGANVHMLYPESYKSILQQKFIFLTKYELIHDFA